MKIFKWVILETKILLPVFSVLILLLFSLEVQATESGQYCSETTNKAFKACRFEAREDLNIDSAKCINVADDMERELCEEAVEEEFAEA